jgi:predicted DNA-binding transcriptional regulator AlpA
VTDELDKLSTGELTARILVLAAELARRATTRRDGAAPPSTATPAVENRLLSAAEAAERLGVAVTWIRRNAAREGLSVRLSPGTVRYSAGAIDDWVKRRRKRA